MGLCIYLSERTIEDNFLIEGNDSHPAKSARLVFGVEPGFKSRDVLRARRCENA